MRTEVVRSDGSIQLGEHARLVGYRPGVAVRVLVTSAATLILSIDDTPVLDVTFKPLVGGAAQQALREGARR